MVSGQTTLIQKESTGFPAGRTICWLRLLSVDGVVLPTRAAQRPPWAPLLTAAVWPAEVQPESEPASKSPLITTLPPGPAIDQLSGAVCEIAPLVPITVTLYVPAAAL